MSAPLPSALRVRIQRYIEDGLSGRAAALRLMLSPATGAPWAQAIRTKGHAGPLPQGRPKGRKAIHLRGRALSATGGQVRAAGGAKPQIRAVSRISIRASIRSRRWRAASALPAVSRRSLRHRRRAEAGLQGRAACASQQRNSGGRRSYCAIGQGLRRRRSEVARLPRISAASTPRRRVPRRGRGPGTAAPARFRRWAGSGAAAA